MASAPLPPQRQGMQFHLPKLPLGMHKVNSLGGQKAVLFEEEKADPSASGRTEEADNRVVRGRVDRVSMAFSSAKSSTQDRGDKGLEDASTRAAQTSTNGGPRNIGSSPNLGALFRMGPFQPGPAQVQAGAEGRNAQRNDLQSILDGADNLDPILTGDLTLDPGQSLGSKFNQFQFENLPEDSAGLSGMQRPLDQQPTSNSQSNSKQNASSESGTGADKKIISDNQPQDIRALMSPKSILNSCQSNNNGLALGDSKNSNQSAGQRVLVPKPMVLQKNNSG